eukprot:3210017-Rhodomonas_salina.1
MSLRPQTPPNSEGAGPSHVKPRTPGHGSALTLAELVHGNQFMAGEEEEGEEGIGGGGGGGRRHGGFKLFDTQ